MAIAQRPVSRLKAAHVRDGVLVVDKPAGITSHDVVAVARRALGERGIGHTGTLDPLATGVLPLAIGKATRLVRFLTASDKDYDARHPLRAHHRHLRRHRHDRPRESPMRPTRTAVEFGLLALSGSYDQMPPPYSAKKVDGRRAYAMARRDEPVELKPVPVTVSRARADGVRRRHGERVDHLSRPASTSARSRTNWAGCSGAGRASRRSAGPAAASSRSTPRCRLKSLAARRESRRCRLSRLADAGAPAALPSELPAVALTAEVWTGWPWPRPRTTHGSRPRSSECRGWRWRRPETLGAAARRAAASRGARHTARRAPFCILPSS